MRAESLVDRGRQKVAGPPTYRIENECNPEAMPQYFQCFVFEMYTNIYDLQRSTLCFIVMEPRCCASPRLLGEADIDMGTVWRQPNHGIFHKWLQLSLPQNAAGGCVGFLKVDISINCREASQRSLIDALKTDLTVHYLMSSGSELQHANYVITVHSAFGLPNTSRHQNDRYHCAKPPSTFVRLLFCGLQAQTAVQNRTNNPIYSEQVSMVEIFPSLNQVLRIELYSTDTFSNRLFASVSLKLYDVSHDGENGFLPTFGPSLLPMYGSPCQGTMPNQTSIRECPYYRGSVLVSLKTVVPYYQQSLRSISVEPVPPINVEYLWTLKGFCIFCPIFEVSMLDSRVSSHICGVAMTIGELSTEIMSDEGFTSMMSEIKTRKLHYTGSLDVIRPDAEYGHLFFSHVFPVLQSTARLPDYRFRMYRNNAIYRIIRNLEPVLNEVERRLKNYTYSSLKELLDELNNAVDVTSESISKFIDIFSTSKCYGDVERCWSTELDKKQQLFQIEEMKKLRQNILQILLMNFQENISDYNIVRTRYSGLPTRKTVKRMLVELRMLVRDLKKLIYRTTEGWPDVVLWLLNDGSRVAYCKISTADIIYADIPELCGIHCGEIKTFYLKPLKCSRHVTSSPAGCFCVAGKVELLAWMGLHKQRAAFEHCLPNEFKLKIKDFDMCVKCHGIMVECRIFVYKAKLFCNNVGDNLSHVFLRINTLNTSKDTEAVVRSSSPVWNQLLRSRRMIVSSSDRLNKHPPSVFVQAYYTDLLGSLEIIGSFEMDSIIDDRTDYNNAPKLQWHEMYRALETTGKVLVSVQILQIPEKILKTTNFMTNQESFTASDIKEYNRSFTDIEVLPLHLIPETSTYKVDIYWWGLRDIIITKKPSVVLEIEDLVIKSDVIADKKNKNCNFPNSRVTDIFEASLFEPFCPPLCMKLYDNCTFGRSLYIGTKVVKRPHKFITTWNPKKEREESLICASIVSSDYVKVSQSLYVKNKSSLIVSCGNEYSNDSELSWDLAKLRTKRSGWRRLFRRKEADEEEYTLLPALNNKSTNIITKTKNSQTPEQRDWWARYIQSQENNFGENTASTGDTFRIYNSELERQPEFSKFKDWCTTMKLYNGDKTGDSKKDEELYCGSLKIGIAIYKWPPPDNTVAVSSNNGVNLNEGYFHYHPSNESVKFLVRIYVIKAINLTTNNFSGKTNPYVIISSGGRNLGSRDRHIPNTSNPIFGKAYELRCTLPEDYQLKMSLYNYDMLESDELIGSTTIDLEDRIYSKHRARVGLSSEYTLSGPRKWRDCIKPSLILKELCAKNHLSEPRFPDNSTVVLNGVKYMDNGEAKPYASAFERTENICLNLLRNWESLPVCGYRLVPEHVETRSIYNDENPGIEQGQIQMWIDIFPLDFANHIPPPVDITPRKSEEYELRVTIFKVKLFKNDEATSSKHSVAYVRAWTGFANQMQNTDSRSVSSDSQYVFNWCMNFTFKYEHAQRKLVKDERNQFTDFEETEPPILVVQLVDNESMSLDEPIAFLTMNLNEMPQGFKDAKYVLDTNATTKKINLFKIGTLHAWWALEKTSTTKKSKEDIIGAVELFLVLLPKQKALVMPVQSGRVPQSSSSSRRLQTDCSRHVFYKHNALWSLLCGVIIMIFIIALTVYLLYTYYCEYS